MVKEGPDVSFMSDIAAAGARYEKFMPWRVLLLKHQYTPAFLDSILLDGIRLDGIYGTKEPGRACPDDYQIVIFVQPCVLAIRVAYAFLAGHNFIRSDRFKTVIEFIFGFFIKPFQRDPLLLP